MTEASIPLMPHDEAEQVVPVGEVLPLNNVSVLDIIPGYADPTKVRKFFEALVHEDTKAVILNSQNANGAVPDTVAPIIRETTERGVPVFVIAGNYGTDHGVLEIRYDSQRQAAEAGAVLIRDVNVNNLGDVAQSAQAYVNQGLVGTGLNQAIIDQYGAATSPTEQAK